MGEHTDQPTMSVLVVTETDGVGNHGQESGAMDSISKPLGDEVDT